MQRFRREVEVAARLDHPNIVAALDASEDRGVHFLRWSSSRVKTSTALVTSGGPLPIELALHCTIQAARGMAGRSRARDRPPRHQARQPDARRARGSVRVLDLGLARSIEAASPLGGSRRRQLTQTGAYMGTVDYIAPEQADDAKKADHRADIYSLGCTLYFLLTGRPPFEGDTVFKKLMAHQERPAPSLRAARPDVPEMLEAAYQAMMAKRPADRPRSMAEVIDLAGGLPDVLRRRAKKRGARLTIFAARAFKRAVPRGRDRGPDASIFARRPKTEGLQFDPDLRLEDLVMDLRPDVQPEPLTEDKLPPKLPRMPRPRKRPQRTSALPALGVVAVLGLCVVGYMLIPGPHRKAPPARMMPAPEAEKLATAQPASRAPEPSFVSLFNGKDLTGWAGDVEGYEARDGAIRSSSRPDKLATIYFFRKQYTDFVARVEFRLSPGANSGLAIRYPGEGNPSESGMCEIQILDDTAPQYANRESRQKHGSLLGMVAARSGRLRPVGEWNAQNVTVQGSKIKVDLNGGVILDTDLSQAHDFMQPHPNKDRTSGYFGLTGIEGPVEFRKIEIMELNTGGSPSSTVAAVGSARVLFVDEFDDPKSGWDQEPADQRQKNSEEHHGYVDGLYRLDGNKAGAWWLWSCPAGGLPEFTCKLVGRVYGENPTGSGAMILLVGGHGHNLQVTIDTRGRLNVLYNGAEPNAPSKEVVLALRSHAAIKTGPRDFNTIVLQLRKRPAKILVNGVQIHEPVTLNWDATPAELQLGIDCWSPNVRAEFDRIEVRAITD